MSELGTLALTLCLLLCARLSTSLDTPKTGKPMKPWNLGVMGGMGCLGRFAKRMVGAPLEGETCKPMDIENSSAVDGVGAGARAGDGVGDGSWAGAVAADEARLGELAAWLSGHVKLTGAAAASYAPLFLQANIGSVHRLRRRLEMEEGMGLLQRLGVDYYDAEDICSALFPPETVAARLGGKSDGQLDYPKYMPVPVPVSQPLLEEAAALLSGGSGGSGDSGDIPHLVRLPTVHTHGTAQERAQAGALEAADDKLENVVAAGAILYTEYWLYYIAGAIIILLLLSW
jgi:hypothetical protein